ncbi:uncharacterized protein LOC141529253 isoform X1 [Cotesia typhae]|uniref:uncharacterized protein LOC141529253 isoform X1 n=1 Tax=Cotesia typhae TaxID=2053667 RepID=UPI003D69F3E4
MSLFNCIVLIVISHAVAYFAFGESAAINSEIALVHEEESQFFPIVKRDSTLSTRSCGATMPCGWLVYRLAGDQKQLTSFLLGSCKCDDGLRCVLEKEKLSTQAYLYYCRDTTSTDRLAPDHDILKPNEELYSLYSYIPKNIILMS